jgi:cytochrome c553
MPRSRPGAARALPAALVALVLLASAAHAAAIDERLAACLACHDDAARGETPSLGAQPAFFVVTQLFLFREGRRDDATMIALARGMTDDDLRGFAAAIAKLPPPPAPAGPADADRIARGAALARRERCGVCHIADFSGREQVPRLAHQREAYLLKAMRDFKRGTRLGYGAAMAQELATLTDGDLRDLAHFLAHLPAR